MSQRGDPWLFFDRTPLFGEHPGATAIFSSNRMSNEKYRLASWRFDFQERNSCYFFVFLWNNEGGRLSRYLVASFISPIGFPPRAPPNQIQGSASEQWAAQTGTQTHNTSHIQHVTIGHVIHVKMSPSFESDIRAKQWTTPVLSPHIILSERCKHWNFSRISWFAEDLTPFCEVWREKRGAVGVFLFFLTVVAIAFDYILEY